MSKRAISASTAPSIALYLGESYASIGLFDNFSKAVLFEKSIFLPQVSLKSLLNQTKLKVQEYLKIQNGGDGKINSDTESELSLPVYIVTKYFDRLKQFRLGGSIAQIILKDFENSYTMSDSKSLSLAATQLIISLDPAHIEENFLEQELKKIKKINPDLSKVVISIPEGSITAAQTELLNNFFTVKDLKVFNCPAAHNQSYLRKTLLNAGSEGTKEEIISDVKEAFGKNALIKFFCINGFQSRFENCELFTSANNFLAHYIKDNNYDCGTYFDIEALKCINLTKKEAWTSPWGSIPMEHYDYTNLSVSPYSEVILNHLSILQIENSVQLEPGPVVAGRAIKPLVIDLFYDELLTNEQAKNLFTQLPQEIIKNKIYNLFSVLEKGQKNLSLAISVAIMKKNILETIQNEIIFYNNTEKNLVFGPLANIYMPNHQQNKKNKDLNISQPFSDRFSWTHEIMQATTKDFR